MDVLTLYLAADDADDENGGMRVVPRSQTWDLAALKASARNGSDVLGSGTRLPKARPPTLAPASCCSRCRDGPAPKALPRPA